MRNIKRVYNDRRDRDSGRGTSRNRRDVSSRRREPETEVLEIEVTKEFLQDMDDLAYEDSMKIEDVVELLLEAYTYGVPEVEIDKKDRVYFDQSKRNGSRLSIRRD